MRNRHEPVNKMAERRKLLDEVSEGVPQLSLAIYVDRCLADPGLVEVGERLRDLHEALVNAYRALEDWRSTR